MLPDMEMEITLREAGELFSILMTTVEPDRLRVRRGADVIGIVQHDFREIHGVLVRISPANGKFGVQVSGEGMLTPTSSEDPCPLPNVVCGKIPAGSFDPASLELRMQFTGAPPGVSVATNPEYRVDYVRILERQPWRSAKRRPTDSALSVWSGKPSALDADDKDTGANLRDEPLKRQMACLGVNAARCNDKGPLKSGPFRRLERETGFEPATSTLARLRSTN
jgi:hypothetical protein